jgi:hypothetical protein
MSEKREAMLLVAIGAKGTGKTYQNLYICRDYVKDKLSTGVRGRKILIFDTNGEYTKESFERAGIKNFDVKKIAPKDVVAFSKSKIIEARRIDARTLEVDEKLETLRYVIQNFKGGMLILEDINSYVLNTVHIRQIVSSIIKARHMDLDIMISYQSLRRLDPIMWANTTYIRMHYQLDGISKYVDRANSEDLMYISKYLVDYMYFKKGNKRFFLYINQYESQIVGAFTKEDFKTSCREYLNVKRNLVKEEMYRSGTGKDEATNVVVDNFIQKYYGNKN